MNAADRATLLPLFHSARQTLLDAIAGLTPEQFHLKPIADAWSIADNLEHVALTEDMMFTFVAERATALDEPRTDAEREAKFIALVPLRKRKVQAPENVQPAGRFASPEEALRSFLDSRARTMAYLETLEDDPRARIFEHPILGPITSYEGMILLALHPARHANQILEVRAAL